MIQAIMPDSTFSENPMKTSYEKVFASHVSAKLTKAAELGISASWTTANHLDALADVCWSVSSTGGKDGIRDVLGECYNVSAFQQMLAKKFEKVPGGHFQREKSKPVSEQADDVFAMLARDVAAK
jgi:hypothetical protein